MGTILVELVLRVPFLSGDTDADQLKKTYHAMGTPTEEDWPVSDTEDCSARIPFDLYLGSQAITRLPYRGRLPKEPMVESCLLHR